MQETPQGPELETAVTGVIGLLTGALGWLFGRRKATAAAVKSEIENLEQAVKIWREQSDALYKKLLENEQRHDTEMQSMRAQVNGLYAKISDMQSTIAGLEQENVGLRAEIAELRSHSSTT